jgi:hypothetical protein
MNITEEMQRKLDRALQEAHECFTVQDILTNIRDGSMQSFAVGDTWAVTQIIDFPRRRVLDVFMLVGNMEDFDGIHEKVENFAREIGATAIRAFGREGFGSFADANGWKSTQRIYYKELR